MMEPRRATNLQHDGARRGCKSQEGKVFAGMMIEHELDGVQLDELTDGGVADRKVVEELKRLRDDRLTRAPKLQVRYDLLDYHRQNLG